MKMKLEYVNFDGETGRFLDVLPQKLTLRKIGEKFLKRTGFFPVETIFEEVAVKPYFQPQLVTDLVARDVKKTNIQDLMDVMKEVIFKRWNPKKFHLIGHSSGCDSRIMSKLIYELREEYGEEWFGDTLFVENQGEGPEFNAIMDVFEFNGIVYNEGEESGEYHREAILDPDFHEKYNGVSTFPVNQWYDSYKFLSRDGFLGDKNIQGFTGYGANETMDRAYGSQLGYEWYYKWSYYLYLQVANHWGGDTWEHPFLDHEFLTALMGLEGVGERASVVMADKLAPEVAHIPHVHTKVIRKRGYRTLSDSLLKEIHKQYKGTWYGQNVDPNIIPTPVVDHNEWWLRYNIASLCDYLLENGHKIRV